MLALQSRPCERYFRGSNSRSCHCNSRSCHCKRFAQSDNRTCRSKCFLVNSKHEFDRDQQEGTSSSEETVSLTRPGNHGVCSDVGLYRLTHSRACVLSICGSSAHSFLVEFCNLTSSNRRPRLPCAITVVAVSDRRPHSATGRLHS